MLGALFESYVFSDIYKSYLNAGKTHWFSTIATKTGRKSICCCTKTERSTQSR